MARGSYYDTNTAAASSPTISMSFRFEPLTIPDVLRITPTRHGDHRGFFSETYRESAFEEAGIQETFHQDNHARSTSGVLRGLHYQAPPRRRRNSSGSCKETFSTSR